MTDAYNVLKYPLSTEKSIRLMESENKLVFIVDRKSTKTMIKGAFEEMFKIKPVQINVLVTPGGKKKAYIKLPLDQPAIDIATKLGIM